MDEAGLGSFLRPVSCSVALHKQQAWLQMKGAKLKCGKNKKIFGS